MESENGRVLSASGMVATGEVETVGANHQPFSTIPEALNDEARRLNHIVKGNPMNRRTRLLMVLIALTMLVLSLACVGGGNGCPAGQSATWHCPDSAETCWQVCK